MKRRIISFILIFVLVAVAAAGAFSAFANTESDMNIVVGIYPFKGFSEELSSGIFSGYCIDYLNEITKYTKLKFSYIMFSDWQACYQGFLDGKVDMIGGAVKNLQRDEQYLFSEYAMATSYLSLYVKQTDTKYSYADYENFNGIKIGITKNNTRTQRLSKHSNEERFVYRTTYFDNEEQLMQSFHEGKIDAFLSDSFYPISAERSIDDFGLMSLYFMLTGEKPWLKSQIDSAMETILIRNPNYNAQLFSKHFKTALNIAPSFTADEQKFIQDNKIVNVNYNPTLAPLSYISSEGVSGISNDIISLALKKANFDTKFVSTEKAETFVTSNGKYNYLVGSVYNNKSLLSAFNLNATNTYIDLPVVLLGATENAAWQSGSKVAVYSQDINMQYYLAENYPHLTPVFVNSVDGCFTALFSQKVDYTIQYSYIVNDYLQSMATDKVVGFTSIYEFMPIAIGLNANAPAEVLSILNKCLAAVSVQERDNMVLLNTIDSPYKMTIQNFIKRNLGVISFCAIILAGLIISYIIYTKNKLSKIAYTDPLTGCDNYAKFLKDASMLLERSAHNYAIISMDINNFKIINDTVGRDEGDAILLQISIAIKEQLTSGELMARNSADNFVVMLKYSSEEELIIRMRKFTSSLQLISVVTDRQIKTPQLAAGIFISQTGDIDIYNMLSNANLARKNAKNSHTSAFAFYDREMHQKILQEKKLENSLSAALANGEFEVYLQPKYKLATRTITGAEALIRWNHPAKGLLPPSKFISICERTGFILDLDFYVYERSFQIIDSWITKGLTPVPVSVNVSRLHLHDPHFVDNFCSIANKYGVPHNLIECELTENLFFEDMNLLNEVVSKFKSNGFFVSIDDFGSGYSSLNMLKEVSVDVLKLDREFFSQEADLPREKVVIQNIIRMAKELNMQVICEGVETEKQAKFLQSVKCDMAQGYLFARPVPEKAFEKILKNSQQELATV